MRKEDGSPGHLGLRLPRKTDRLTQNRPFSNPDQSSQRKWGVLARNDAEAHVARCKVTHVIAMAGAIARIDDGVWTAIEHVNAIFDEDQQRLISVPAQAVPSGWAMRVVVMGVRATCWSQAGALDGVSARWVNRIAFMEDVLFVEWREGALLGTRPEDAFSFAATRPR